MTKQDLLQLESLLEKFNESYGDEIHRARYRELKTLASTVNGIILEGKYDVEDTTVYKHNLCSNEKHCMFEYTLKNSTKACGGFSGTRCIYLTKEK